MSIRENKHIRSAVEQYASCIAFEDVLNRIFVHKRLLDTLSRETGDHDWDFFRPFESEEIVKIPTYEECTEMLWKEIELWAEEDSRLPCEGAAPYGCG